MHFTFRASVCFLVLSLISPALAQSQSDPNLPASPDVHNLAAALVRAGSEQEQDRLLAQRKHLIDASLLIALKDLISSFDRKGDYAEAMRIAHLAVRVAERIGDRVRLGNAVHNLGLMYRRQNRPAEARNCFQRSLALFEEAGDKRGKARSLYEIGVSYASERRFEQALEYYDKALAAAEEAGDRRQTALTLNSIGNAHHLLGRYEIGMEFYEKSRAISEELNDRATLALVLNNISVLYIYQGRYAEALDCLLKSIQIDEERGSNSDKTIIALRLQNIGLIYRRQGHLDHALEYSRKSLKILEDLNDVLRVADLQNNIGVIYKQQGLYEQALEWFEKSLRRYEEKRATRNAARVLNNIGDALRLQGRFDQALEKLQKSLQLRKESNDRGGISLTLNNLARLYRGQGKYAEMLEVSRQSAGLAEEINSREELWKAQEHIGRALHALGRPAEARRYYLAAIDTIESLRHEVAGGEQQRQSFLENRLAPWVGAVALLVSQKEYAEALALAEQSKARVLLDALQEGRARLRKSLSQREMQTEQEHRIRLVSLNTQLTDELRRDKPDAARVAELKTSIDKARLAYEDLETSLYAAHPELRVQRGEAPIINAQELADLLPTDAAALLEYVVADDKTYLFVITKAPRKDLADIRAYTVPIKRIDLAKQIEAFRRRLASRDLGFRAPAADLCRLLLKPAEAQLRGKTNLIIAPDDTLWDLPFQALLAGPDRFLIQDAAIAYAPSLTALREIRKRMKNQDGDFATTTLLALGNPLLGRETVNRATMRDGRLDPLPDAEQEVRALGRLYGTTHSRVYTGAEAREDRVKAEAGRARVLHFATHGTLNNASPMYSHLVLAGGGSGEDGLLEAWELMQLDLKAELAVLSACETARGRVGTGEGVIGLSWAMFIAGVPSIVVSQWKVESAGTRDIMVDFHRAFISRAGAGRARLTKTEALRRAALKLLRNPATRHPFYWAGFVLVGDGR